MDALQVTVGAIGGPVTITDLSVSIGVASVSGGTRRPGPDHKHVCHRDGGCTDVLTVPRRQELLGFIANWNEFLLALAYTSVPARQTVPVGIANFQSQYFIPWGDMAAASVVVTVPLILIVLFFQRRVVAGITAGGVKE